MSDYHFRCNVKFKAAFGVALVMCSPWFNCDQINRTSCPATELILAHVEATSYRVDGLCVQGLALCPRTRHAIIGMLRLAPSGRAPRDVKINSDHLTRTGAHVAATPLMTDSTTVDFRWSGMAETRPVIILSRSTVTQQ